MDVVLIHGTTQSPDGWGRLADALGDRGHRVHLLDLPVDQPDLHADDYAAIAAAQAPDVADPIVVAHSAGGLLLPAIAHRLGAVHMVWLSATVPDTSGERSFVEEVREYGADMFGAEWLALREPPTIDLVVAAYFLFHDCDLATLQWALTTVRLFYPAGVYQERMPGSRDWPPSTFVMPRSGRSLRPEWMRKTARERLGVEPVEVDGGHCPHVSRPAQIADIIEQNRRQGDRGGAHNHRSHR
jgi:pimeloyl-ACP methyl ester carboxylesterase